MSLYAKRRTFIAQLLLFLILPRSILQELSATNNVSVFRFSPAAETIFIRRSMRFIIFVDSSNVRLLLALPAHLPSLSIPVTLLAECCLAFLREFLLRIEIAFVLPSTRADRWKWTIKRSTNPPRIVWKRWSVLPQKAVAFKTRCFFVTTIYVWEVKRMMQEKGSDVCLKSQNVAKQRVCMYSKHM